MRRLTAWLYGRCLGLRVRSNEQHLADLQRTLNDLTHARQAIDAEIDRTADQFLAALARRDELARQAPKPRRRTSDIPRINLDEVSP